MPGLDETESSFRVRQKDPSTFDRDSFRTIDIGKRVKAVVGCPKGSYENGSCKVGMQVQTYIFPKDNFKTKDEVRQWIKKNAEADAAEAKAACDMMNVLDGDELSADVTLGQPGDRPGQQPQPTPTGDPTKPQGLGESQYKPQVDEPMQETADTDRPITIAPGSTCLNDAPSKEIPLHDGMDRMDKEVPPAEANASARQPFFSIPAYHMSYSAAPKFEGEDAPIIIKAVVLEEGINVNGWRVLPDQFRRVAEQYKAGRQLRTDHEKSVANVIGKSFDGAVTKGEDLKTFLGKDIPGIDPDGLYVVAEFEANPRDPQVRTNILNGYVVTGSIGLDAEALCEQCGTPLKAAEDGEMVRQCHHLDSIIDLTNVEVKEYSYVAEPAFEHTQAFPSFSAAVGNRLGLEAKEQTTKERNKLEESEFAYPEERKLPINDAAHVRNALARWNQTDIPSDKKSEVLGRICRAAKKFGIDSDLCREKGKTHAESSLLSGERTEGQMSNISANAARKKAEGEDDAEGEGDVHLADADAILKAYKQGQADAAKLLTKFRADGKAPPEEEEEDDGTQAEAESEGEGEGEGRAEAESESESRSEAESEGEGEGEADSNVSTPPPLPGQKPKVPAKFAKRKTDQIARTAPSKSKMASKFSLMDRVWDKPTMSRLESSGLKEVFIAAAKTPNAPRDVVNKLRGLYE